MKYKVDFTPQAFEDISKLDRAVIDRITNKIEWLSESLDAISPQALKGKFHGTFKLVSPPIRQGQETNLKICYNRSEV